MLYLELPNIPRPRPRMMVAAARAQCRKVGQDVKQEKWRSVSPASERDDTV